MTTGGDALNVAVTLKKLGVDATLSCYIGNDVNGDFILERLTELGIDTQGVLRHSNIGTAVCYILIEDDGQRHFLSYSDIHEVISDRDVSDEQIEKADIVFYGSAMAHKNMDTGGAAALFKRARRLGKMTVADATLNDDSKGGNYWRNQLGSMLNETDFFLPSYEEAVLLTGELELSNIREAFSRYGLKNLVVKLGERGCYLTDFKTESFVPAINVPDVVDTTGAGDSFVGGLLRGVLVGWPIETSALFANAVASFNVKMIGATAGVPDFDTAYKFVTQNYGGEKKFPI